MEQIQIEDQTRIGILNFDPFFASVPEALITHLNKTVASQLASFLLAKHVQ